MLFRNNINTNNRGINYRTWSGPNAWPGAYERMAEAYKVFAYMTQSDRTAGILAVIKLHDATSPL